jgi:glycosyltransferase involved in cell wall biosynthesis
VGGLEIATIAGSARAARAKNLPGHARIDARWHLKNVRQLKAAKIFWRTSGIFHIHWRPNPMHITLYKRGDTPIPPRLYGGAERFVYWLGKTLVELGHQVTLIANAQSHIPGAELRSVAADEDADPQACARLVPDSTDIVHLWDYAEVKKPFLFSVGGNGRPGEKFPANTVFVSSNHAANHGSRHFAYSGVIPGNYSFSEKRADYAVFLAKARWKAKNLHGAAAVARRAGLELRVIGSRNLPMNLQRLLPPIRGVRYYGMIEEDEKRDLLSRARCLIFPVRWHEPFGLAITEALASGAFVAGTPYGALPEIITPEAGALSINASELAEAVKNPQRFNPQACRNRVLHGGFTLLDSARKYIECYERILSHGSLNEPGEPLPETRPGFMAKQLLPWVE